MNAAVTGLLVWQALSSVVQLAGEWGEQLFGKTGSMPEDFEREGGEGDPQESRQWTGAFEFLTVATMISKLFVELRRFGKTGE